MGRSKLHQHDWLIENEMKRFFLVHLGAMRRIRSWCQMVQSNSKQIHLLGVTVLPYYQPGRMIKFHGILFLAQQQMQRNETK